MKNLKVLFIASLVLPVVACGHAGEEASESTPDEAVSAEASMEVVADIETPTGRVTFYSVDGDGAAPGIAIAETVRIGVGASPLGKLLAEQKLTSLEIFRAITDDVAPQAIVDAHADEASELGREDLGVREVTLDLNDFVEKISTGSCDAIVLPPSNSVGYSKTRRWNAKSSYGWHTLGSGGLNPPLDWSYRTASDINIGMCNDSSSTVETRLAWDMDFDSSGFIRGTLYTVDPGYARYWRAFHRNTESCSSSGGFTICGRNKTRYAIWTDGPRHHVRSAEPYPIIK